MQDKLQELNERLARFLDLTGVNGVLQWDQETYMPSGGAQARADQMATIEELRHRIVTDEAIGRLLDELAPYEAELDYDSDEAAMIRVARREYEKRVRVPADLVAEIQRTASLGGVVWQQARAENDWAKFEPLLAKMVDLKTQWAECFAPYDNIYDPLLDDYEPGITYDQINAVFQGLKPHLVALVEQIRERQDAVDDSVLRREYDEQTQYDLGREMVEKLGYDFNRGRIDTSEHPFTIGFGLYDVRITTRADRYYLPSSLMSTIHEGGHAIYEQNVAPHFYRTVLGTGASMSIHESQSRFYENIIGRSRPFWAYWFPRVQEAFPHLADVDLETFYRALNKSEPSLIRIDADEVTYGLHIILRFELENDLFNGRVKVEDLPREWNERMGEYLGVVPETDAQGVLQDIHWSQGYFGYFPDYLLGSIFSVQLWDAMRQDIPDVTAQIERGEFEGVTGWLTEKVHRHGVKYTLPELADRATGQPLTWEPYMAYLSEKFGEIYGLK